LPVAEYLVKATFSTVPVGRFQDAASSHHELETTKLVPTKKLNGLQVHHCTAHR
jgi:hypothetical protein